MRDDGAGNLWAVGYITGSHGIRGFVKIKLLTDTPERFKRLGQVFRGLKPEETVEDRVVKVEIRDRFVLVKLRSVSDKTCADTLKGQYIFIIREDVEIPVPGRYFVHDIVGCKVQTTDGRQIGIVTEVYKMPAHDLWEIDSGKKRFLIPAVKEFIRSVDCKNRMITVKVIDGLTDG
jgi:16S rRNA processing protein RimM